MYYLQNRWVLRDGELVYYGLRSGKGLLKNRIRLSRPQRRIVASLPRELSKGEIRRLGRLMKGIVVPEALLRTTPRSLSEAVFCKNCCANDFIIPGLELDEKGLCPMCATEKLGEKLRSILPLAEDIPRCPDSPFDAALFYTGGKDSSFLLYHLSVTLGLRVLAMTWDIPFMSPSARASMENAKKLFPNVVFVSKKLPEELQRRFYRRLYELAENTCACPSLAYVLFYPLMVEQRVPCFLAGNEPAQMLGLYYNGMAPKAAYSPLCRALLTAFGNLGRLLSLRRPLKRGQFHTLAAMGNLARRGVKKNGLYKNELVDNVVEALQSLPEIMEPFRDCLKRSRRSGNIPAFVHMDLDRIAGGSYDWRKVKELLVNRCGWVAPESGDKALHTSCSIERCKEYSQFVRFYHCRSSMIPFSAIEIALAGRGRNLSRAQAMEEMEKHLGFSLEEVPECALMREYLEAE